MERECKDLSCPEWIPHEFQMTDEWGAFTDLYVQPGVNWVICGGETGPKSRPVHPDW